MPANQYICKKDKEEYMFECVEKGKVSVTQMGKRGLVSHNTIPTEKAIKLWGDLKRKGFEHITE
jgi:hypothetical protein